MASWSQNNAAPIGSAGQRCHPLRTRSGKQNLLAGDPLLLAQHGDFHVIYTPLAAGLNNPGSVDYLTPFPKGFVQQYIGAVPYLNGGLFEKDTLDERADVSVPDDIFPTILDGLLYRYNFTVTESTPLDVEVAVDPEMLGKIFEELVTGRHESGSYYTPKPVVAFMCRAALKGYLRDACPREAAGAVAAFVDGRDPGGFRTPERVLEALNRASLQRALRALRSQRLSGAAFVTALTELYHLHGLDMLRDRPARQPASEDDDAPRVVCGEGLVG